MPINFRIGVPRIASANYIYGNWLARSGLRHSGAADIESYGADYHPTAESSVIRYAIPVQE